MNSFREALEAAGFRLKPVSRREHKRLRKAEVWRQWELALEGKVRERTYVRKRKREEEIS